jgi:hypothetical protein
MAAHRVIDRTQPRCQDRGRGPLQAIFHTDYSKEIKALEGQKVELMGFIYPLEGGLEHARSLLTAWPRDHNSGLYYRMHDALLVERYAAGAAMKRAGPQAGSSAANVWIDASRAPPGCPASRCRRRS